MSSVLSNVHRVNSAQLNQMEVLKLIQTKVQAEQAYK